MIAGPGRLHLRIAELERRRARVEALAAISRRRAAALEADLAGIRRRAPAGDRRRSDPDDPPESDLDRSARERERIAELEADLDQLTALSGKQFEYIARLELDAARDVRPATTHLNVRGASPSAWSRIADLLRPGRTSRSKPVADDPGLRDIDPAGSPAAEAAPSPPLAIPVPEEPRRSTSDETSSRTDRQRLLDRLEADLKAFLASGEMLRFEPHRAPDVSVVIVLWNKAHLTLKCLRALLDAGERIEVILVDNASSDATSALLDRVEGIRVCRNETNEGFLLATNRGVALARGRDVLLLNNDAFVRPGAIGAALATLRSRPDIGAVGGRLVRPDGRLQEAGSIVWADGGTQGYACGDDPETGEAMFRRDVDYCSAAFLLTGRATWIRFGGFDASYAPAYYEEVDYCLRLGEAGLRTIYEPDAVVDHIEFGSEVRKGEAVAAMLRNRKRLRQRHSATLLAHHLPQAPDRTLVARHAAGTRRRRLLVVDDAVPLAVLGSGFPRAREILIGAIAAGWSVTFYATAQVEPDWPATRSEIPPEVEVILGRGKDGLPAFVAARSGYFDAILVSRPHNMTALLSGSVRSPLAEAGTRLIYDAEAIFALRGIERARILGTPVPQAEQEASIDSELAICEAADAIVCVSPSEAQLFRGRLPGTPKPVHVVSHPVVVRTDGPGFADRNGFLFVGRLLERGSPNWDGLAWFVRACWPGIREAIPGATATIAGYVHPDHEELLGAGIRVLGPVADLGPVYDRARVFVAPIRFAAGVPIKILEAAAADLPCIGTMLMARQLEFRPGLEMIAEDSPGAFALQAAALHEDRCRWTAIRDSARNRLARDFDQESFRRALIGALG